MEVGWLDTPEEWTDLFTMMYMVAGTVAFLFIIIFTIIIGFLTASILSRIRRILKDSVQPAAVNVRDATLNAKATVTYISDTAIRPVVRAYGIAIAARQFARVVTRFTGKDNESR